MPSQKTLPSGWGCGPIGVGVNKGAETVFCGAQTMERVVLQLEQQVVKKKCNRQ